MLLASDYDKSKYFKATDLDREKKFRIKNVTEEALNDGKGKTEKKLCLWFTNDLRGLILNKTNLRTLKGAFGDDTAGWAAKVIAIFPIMADNGKQGLSRLRQQHRQHSRHHRPAMARRQQRLRRRHRLWIRSLSLIR